MVKIAIIARKSDGLVFCEINDDTSNDKNLMMIRNKAIDFLKNLQSKEDLCTVNIDSQNYLFQ